MSELRAAFYGDDFTGSVDVLLQYARQGLVARLLVGRPDAAALRRASAGADAVGIAGIARSLPTAALEAELRPAFTALAGLGARIVQYKACSTADSSPTIGSLGRALEIARDVFGPQPVPILFAQPDFGRYTAFGHHFAAEGGRIHRLDRQPTMSRHPSTPMTESDLALHLSRQTTSPIGAVHLTSYTDVPALAATLRTAEEAAIVLDAVTDDHVRLVGATVAGLPAGSFALGSGGLTRGLAEAWSETPATLPTGTGEAGPILAVSGSRSPRTRAQIAAAAAEGWIVLSLFEDPALVLDLLAAGCDVVLDAADADGGDDMLARIAETGADAVGRAVSAGLSRRIVVFGGDTSSRLVSALGVRALTLSANPWGNVVLLRAQADDPRLDGIEFLLKGGQVGAVDLLPALRALPRRTADRAV